MRWRNKEYAEETGRGARDCGCREKELVEFEDGGREFMRSFLWRRDVGMMMMMMMMMMMRENWLKLDELIDLLDEDPRQLDEDPGLMKKRD